MFLKNNHSLVANLLFFSLLTATVTSSQAESFINIETNAGWTGFEYTEAITDIHLGFEGRAASTDISYYFQLGPAIASEDEEGLSTRLSGKAGADASFSKSLAVYGEVYFLTSQDEFIDDIGAVGKLGLKYRF